MEKHPVLAPGTQVRLKSDPGRHGVITGKFRDQAGIRKYQIGFPDGKSFQPEYELEILLDDNSDWVELLETGRFGRITDLRRNLTHIHLSGRLANLVYSMDATNTDFYAYQYKPVLSFLDSPSNGLLIADEVGLGKTIEAGLIWTELRARFDARRLLVVCPAMLREKWCVELSRRFGVDAIIMDAGELLSHLKLGKFEVPDGKGIVCSMQGLRPPKNWDRDDGTASNYRKSLARFLDAESDNEPLIDLVIFDEAHYLRNPESQTAKLGNMLRAVSENVVLLSATPINLHSDDLFHLLNLVDPDSFGVKEVFPQVLSANEPLQRARELALDISATASQIRDKLNQAACHPLLAKSHQLKDLLKEEFSESDLNDKAIRIKLANRIERINLLRNAVTRTRKTEVTEWKVLREPVKAFAPLDPEGPEWAFYNAVTETVRRYAFDADISDGFLLAGPQRQVSSCMYAAAQSWLSKVENYNEQLYEDFGYSDEKPIELSPLFERLRSEVLPNVNLDLLKLHDGKFKIFKDTIVDYLKNNVGEKIVVFSFFRKTLTYLAERLAEEGIQSQILKGGMKETKQEIIDKFRISKDIRILLSSEVASEGVDLQFCKVLVNYDLPWNPMKVEQRIGRIDRLGQQAQKISIINLLYKDTIDHRIHDRLYARLDIFKKALGGMEAILGEEISNLTSDLLSRPLTEEQQNQRIEQTALAIERIKIEQDELEDQASNLIAHGGYIIEEVQAAHQFKKRITEQDLITYVSDYLNRHGQGHDFTQTDNTGLKFDIRLPAHSAAALHEFIKNKRLFGQTQLATGSTIRCIFSNKVKGQFDKYETISQFHPLIRFISYDLIEKDETFYPLVAVEVDADNHEEYPPGDYAFFVSRWVFSGIKVEEELPVRVVHMQSGKAFRADDSWGILNRARVQGHDWLSASNQIDLTSLQSAIQQCDEAITLDYQKARRQRENENIDRVTLQIDSAKKHRDRQLKTRMDVLEKYKLSGNTRMIPATEGRIRKVIEKFEIQVETLKQKSELRSSQSEVCCGVIHLS